LAHIKITNIWVKKEAKKKRKKENQKKTRNNLYNIVITLCAINQYIDFQVILVDLWMNKVVTFQIFLYPQ